jgi:hypothetical protein
MQFLVKGQNPTFDHDRRIFSHVKDLVKGFMEASLVLLPSTTADKSSNPIAKGVSVGTAASAQSLAAAAAAADLSSPLVAFILSE